ncbi:MAG: cytochrome c-type biogenesis protein CcmH [Cytophagales bacterium]|nr:cytochrome c-type biogenesis protein CcmH [Rhizobacter sp.]
MTLAVIVSLTAVSAHANEAAPLAEDPVIEQRLINITEELRCLVCQNESLAGSRSDLAMDLRREIRTLIKQGKTDQQVRDFLVTRYGDYVLYRPPVKPTTWLLWGGPFVLLVGGLAGLILFLRRRKPADAVLSPEDQRRADALLNNESKDYTLPNNKDKAKALLKGDS